GLVEVLGIVRAEHGAADLREILGNLGNRLLGIGLLAGHSQSAYAETPEKTMAPAGQRVHLRVERTILRGQQRLERHLLAIELSPGSLLERMQRFAQRALTALPPLLEMLDEPAVRRGDAAHAHHAAQTAV